MSDERSELLAFLNVFATNIMPQFEGVDPTIPSNTPLQGLRMAVGDMLEMTAPLSAREIAEIESLLAAAGAPSLAATRLRYSKRLNTILRRGRIRSDTEYHLVRNFAEGMDHQTDGKALWALISANERA